MGIKNQNLGFVVGENDFGDLGYECPVDHDGSKVFVRVWPVENPNPQPVLISHDLGETMENYYHAIEALNKLGYNVYGYDMRGHGRSGRRQGHIQSFKALVSDMLQICSSLRFIYDQKAPIVLSQGLGSMVTLAVARSYPQYLSGAVFVSPMFRLESQVGKTKRFLIKLLADLWPELALPGFLSLKFTQDRTVEVHGKKVRLDTRISSHFAIELMNAVNQSRRLISRLTIPSLFVCPQSSQILRFEFIKKVLTKHSDGHRQQLVMVETDKHGLLSDSKDELQTITKYIAPWLNEFYSMENDSDPSEGNETTEKVEGASKNVTKEAQNTQSVASVENSVSDSHLSTRDNAAVT